MTRHVFINANLLDGNQAARPGSTIIVEGRRIAAVSAGTYPPDLRADDRIYDLAGKTLMPGMVSGHFHSTMHNLGATPGVPSLETPPAVSAYRAVSNAQLALRAGFTSVAGAGCAYDIDPALAKAVDAGWVEGPRVLPCSPDHLSSGGMFQHWWLDHSAHSGIVFADGVDEIRKLVRQQVTRGVQLFKMTTSGGHGIFNAKDATIFTPDEIRGAVDAAHDLGIRVRTHVAGKRHILTCIKAGVDILDHCDGMDEECIDAMVEAGVFVLPSLYQPRRLLEVPPMFGFDAEDTRNELEWMCKMLPRAVKAGVKLVTGDDFGTAVIPHGNEYGRELAVYAEFAGIEPLEVIRWATRNGAGLMLRSDDLGTIETGKLADLIVVDGDPSRDIKLLGDPANIRAVMRDGSFFSKAGLQPSWIGPQ